MRSRSRLKIVFYDPSGRGGICHYTFQLAEALALAGCDVNVITTENYELAGLPRHFTVTFLYKRSWIKSVLLAFMPKILDERLGAGIQVCGEGGEAHDHAAHYPSIKPELVEFALVDGQPFGSVLTLNGDGMRDLSITDRLRNLVGINF